ncbi:uncharacterized protein ATC70_008804 [Mucor velutinosus]|uniref:Uncharacterized protein n=1 Tax=Mucor velutinosus TaxID=708070 RepID=A0AAN7HUS3_9FUNG|nr:hypothetical protein ATC70_008804 [Mucor velutinosus]
MTAYHRTSARIDHKNHFDMCSTEQFASEQSIFHQHRDQNKLLIYIPALSPKSHHYPNLFLSAAAANNTKKPLKMRKALLETTSKTPLNVGLDNVLFISTLDGYWTRTTSYRMKRHASNGSGTQNSDNAINASTLTTRRYSHPNTNKASMSTKPMMECPSVPCSSSTSSSSSSNQTQMNYDMRRLSFQSDAASTELIRRFSSESTTSSLSSISSFILESHSKLHQQYQQQQQQKAQEASSDAQTSHPVVLAHSNSIQLEAAAAAAAAAPTVETGKGLLDRDPGHACETMHNPSKEMQQIQGTNIKEEDQVEEREEEQQLPIWADPIKVKENPTRFQYTKSYLQQRGMLNDGSLPLIKPCVFYFSDTAGSRVTTQSKQPEYISTVKPVFECGSVWEFAARWRTFKEKCNKKPSQLTANQNIFCFIHGIQPMWEDPVNKDGGRFFVIVYDNQLLGELFEWILCAFVGGNFAEDGVVGVTVSKRFRGDRIEFWFDKSADESKVPEFKNKLYDLLASTCHDVIKAGRFKKHFG